MSNPSTQNQTASNSILDQFNRQSYLGNSYIVGLSQITTTSTNTEYPLLYMSNASSPSTSTSPAVSCFNNLRKLQCGDISGASGVLFRIYLNASSVSGGTSVTPANMRTGSSNTSVMTVLKQPTVGTKGTLIATFPVGWSSQNFDPSLLIIDPGNNILITGQPITGSSTAVVEASWYEI